MNRVERLLIYSNPERDREFACAKKAAAIAENLGVSAEIVCSDCERAELTGFLRESDMVAVFGGDGTILSAAVPATECGVPVLGINLGKLGFMSAFDASDEERLAEVLGGDYLLDRRALLSVSVMREGSETFRAAALNDAVVSAGEFGRTVSLGIYVDAHIAATLRGDGVIAATPTGSTAYSLSAGGPIIDPRSDCMVLTPVCAHTPYARPMVLPFTANAELRIPERAALTVDGQPGAALERGDRVILGRYEREACLVRLKNYDFYAIIGTKLWQTEMTEVDSL